MFEIFDRWNQRHLEKMNREEKEVMSRSAELILKGFFLVPLVVLIAAILWVGLTR